MIGTCWHLRVATFCKKGNRVRADARKEVLELLAAVGDHKKAKRFVEKFNKTSTLSKREIKVLRDLARKRRMAA